MSSTLLQISGLQGQALGRRLASWIVAHRQLWLLQARVPDADKAALLDVPISPGHTLGPAVEEILQRSHRECEASRQVATCSLPALLRGAGRTTGDLLRRGLSPGQFQSPRLHWVTKGIAYRAHQQQTTGPTRKAEGTQDVASPHTPASQEEFPGPAP
ncbi:UNVERIFIED_CONTAM: hypothetical protein FKN15_072355 [Acipenser sinensis]